MEEIIQANSSIEVGAEQPKYIAVVPYANGEHGTCFMKRTDGADHYYGQEDKHRRLQSAGINVPKEFIGQVCADESVCILATDLTDNGEKLVLSPNNPEIRSFRHAENARQLSSVAKRRIAEGLFRSAEKAAKTGLYLASNAYGLVLDPQNYEEGEPYAIDFGVDVLNSTHPYADLVGRNLYSAGDFMAMVLGHVPELSDHPRYKRYIERYGSSWKEDADYFWAKSDKDSLQDIRLQTKDKVSKAIRKIVKGGHQSRTDNLRRKVDVMQMHGMAHVKMTEGGLRKYRGQELRHIKTEPLGACIALVLYNRTERFGMVAHIAITNDVEACVAEVFRQMEREGLHAEDFEAKVFGGSVPQGEGSDRTATTVKHSLMTIDKVLAQKQIPITEADVEGVQIDRCILLDLADGSINDYVQTEEAIKKDDVKIETFKLPLVVLSKKGKGGQKT